VPHAGDRTGVRHRVKGMVLLGFAGMGRGRHGVCDGLGRSGIRGGCIALPTGRPGAMSRRVRGLEGRAMVRPVLFGMALSVLVTGPHAARVDRALRLVKAVLESSSGAECRGYFEARGWPGAGPLVITTDAAFPERAEALATVAAGEPWSVIQLNPEKLAEGADPGLGDCGLASLLLHEMGHLARHDKQDSEPRDFFQACHVRCLNPGRWR
jgi:hypothetical protein